MLVISGRVAKRSSSRLVTEGASSASPAVTTRMPAMMSAGGASLSRNPLAPAESAPTTYSSRSNVVSTITLGPAADPAPQMRRVASTPSIRGMRMSMRTTSGLSRAAMSTASAPSAA